MQLIQTKRFAKWIAKLKDRTALSLIADRLDRLEEGHFGDAKSVGSNVSELRIHYGGGYRIYYTRRDDEIIILLAGGLKRSQKRDIEYAQEMAKSL